MFKINCGKLNELIETIINTLKCSSISRNDWKLVIKKARNGYILSGKFADSDLVSDMVMEIPEKEFGEQEAAQKVLWEVLEYFGVYYSKHSKKNVVVAIKETKE